MKTFLIACAFILSISTLRADPSAEGGFLSSLLAKIMPHSSQKPMDPPSNPLEHAEIAPAPLASALDEIGSQQLTSAFDKTEAQQQPAPEDVLKNPAPEMNVASPAREEFEKEAATEAIKDLHPGDMGPLDLKLSGSPVVDLHMAEPTVTAPAA